MNLRASPWTQIQRQAPRNLTYKLTPSIPFSLEREGEAEGRGEFIKLSLRFVYFFTNFSVARVPFALISSRK